MTAYATTEQFAEVIGVRNEVPTWDVGDSPVKETVGTGDESNATFWLDQRFIIASSYTLYYGATEAAATALTETTHYTLDKDKGKITLTTAGKSTVSTNNIYAEYSYFNNGMRDSYITTVLNRAKEEVDKLLNTTFTDGTASNPSYPVVTDERQESLGISMNRYWTKKRPVKDVNSVLANDLAAAGTTAAVTSGDGTNFPSSGQIIIGTEIISYTGTTASDILTGLTRGVGDSTAAAHSADDEVHTAIIQISGTQEGTAPTWYPREWKKDVSVDDLGEVFLYENYLLNDGTGENIILPRVGVANRIRLRYMYGFDTIPDDIVRLNLLLAKRMLTTDNISKAMIAGRNEFRPEMLNADLEEINRIVGAWKQIPMQTT